MKARYKDASNYKYQLVEDWLTHTGILGAAARIPGFITLAHDGVLTVHRGYAWDGASGPTIDTKSSIRASLAHDAIYQLERAGHLGQEWRDKADEILRDLCIEDGMWEWRANLWLWTVRKFAASSAARRDEVIEVAP